jgi:hypothetical protein
MNETNSGSEQLTPSSSDGAFVYSSRELEAMDEASNYHRWILGIFAPYLWSPPG